MGKRTITNYHKDSICIGIHSIIHQNSGFTRGKHAYSKKKFHFSSTFAKVHFIKIKKEETGSLL